MLLKFTAKPVQVWRPGTLSNIRRTPRLSTAKSQPGLARRQLHLGWVCCDPFKGQYQAAGNDHANGPNKIGKYAAGGMGDIHAVLSGPVERSSSSLVFSESNQPQDRQRAPATSRKSKSRCKVLRKTQGAIAAEDMALINTARTWERRDSGVHFVQKCRSATRWSSRTRQLP